MVTIQLATCETGTITVTKIMDPYGANSGEVLSIGVSLNDGSTPDWKVHIPAANVDAVIEALKSLK
jgi:hypothetical protein